MKKLLSIITVLISLISFSQKSEFSYIKGKLHKDKNFTEMVFSESDDKGGFFVLKRSASGVGLSNIEYKLDHLDSKMKVIDSYIYEKKHYEMPNFSPIIGMYKSENKIILIEHTFEKKTTTCNALISNQDKLLFNEKKELYTDNENSYDKINYIPNKNNTSFVLTFSIVKKNILENKLVIYDNKLNKKSEILFSKDTKRNNYLITNIQLANDSKNVFITATFNDDKKNNCFELNKLNQESQKNITFKNSETTENKLVGIEPFLNNEDVHVFSYYTDQKEILKGIAYQKTDFNNFTANKFIYNEFSEQFFLDKFSDSKKTVKIYNITFKYIFMNENNEFYINTEESSTNLNIKRFNRALSPEGYSFLDIHLIKLNSDGKLVWSRLINKLHVSSLDMSYVSFFTFMKNNHNYLIFNAGKVVTDDDHSKNRPYFRQTFGHNQDLIAIKVDSNGNYTYETIFDDTKNDDFMCEIKDAKLFNNDFILLGSKRDDNQFFKYTIN